MVICSLCRAWQAWLGFHLAPCLSDWDRWGSQSWESCQTWQPLAFLAQDRHLQGSWDSCQAWEQAQDPSYHSCRLPAAAEDVAGSRCGTLALLSHQVPGTMHQMPTVRGPSRGSANDYCQHFVDTGQRPQNFLRDGYLTDRYAEYPKLKELVERKDSMAKHHATPPMFLQADLKKLSLSPATFGTKFDVVLIDPPWEEYARRAPGVGDTATWTWQEIIALDIDAVTDSPGFVFLW
eukprot:jgi/Astpho2/4925/Aster-05852